MTKIYSRKRMEKLLSLGKSLKNCAVISFCDTDLQPINYECKANRVFTILLDDISHGELKDEGLTNEQFFKEADALAEFICKAKSDGLHFICQCEFGQSRSAGCAAAVLQHFERSGITVFSEYKYYPNKLIYHKVLEALERYKTKTE